MPKVTEVEPVYSGLPVPLDVTVRIAFNQAMDRTSVEAAFTLSDGAGLLQRGAFTWNDDATEVEFQPSTRLQYDTDYEARLEANASAPSGSSLGSGLRIFFHTAGRPAILSSKPSEGGQKDEWDGVLLTFGGPMDPASLRRALTLTPAVENLSTWWNEESYTLSIYGDFDPSRSYTLTMATSAADPFGSKLASPFSLRFSTLDLRPITGFMRYATVLSLDASRQPVIQVQARNADRLDFSLYRLSMAQFFGLLRDGVYAAADSPIGELLRQWPVSVSPARNVMQTLNISLQSEPLPTGAYLLLMNAPYYDGYRTEARLVVVRDTELVLKAAHDSALTWGVDLASGQPLSGLPIEIVNESGNTIARGTTAADGTADIEFTPAENDYAPTLAVTGSPGESPFGIASTAWAEEIYPYTFGVDYDPTPPRTKVYLYTDRPIYRPGQTVYFRGVLRDVDDARYSVPSTHSVEVRLLDGFGEESGKTETSVNEYGAFSGAFELPSGAALGVYSIDTEIGSVPVTVAAYRKPEFEVTVEPSASDVGFGDKLEAVIQGEYYFGGPVADASVQWTAWAQPYFPPDLPQPIDWFAFAEGIRYDSGQMLAEGEGQTDSQGRLQISLPTTPEGSSGLEVTVTAVLTDSAGMPVQGEASLRLHPASAYFGLNPESYAVSSGSSTPVAVTAVDWDDAPVGNQKASLTVDRITWNQTVQDDGMFGWEEQAERISESTLTLDASGKATYSFRPERSGTYHLRVEGKDAAGRTASSSLTLWVYGPEAFSWRSTGTNRIALVADRSEYEPGDTARILIPSPFSQTVSALVTIERAHVLSHQVIEVPAGQTTIDLPLDESHAPNVFVSVVLIQPSGSSGPATLAAGLIELSVSAAEHQLNVSVTSDRPQAGPGEEVTYRVKATDAQGKPVQAEFSLSLADVAVLALAEPNSTDPFTAFYSPFPLGVLTGSALAVSGEGGEGIALSADGRRR
ncbi:MAG: MG2 domain-containing protein [Chloroflexi bacterium]|nr:MG2 domain-containing protein [Chloroflexota bacterium]